MRLWRNVQSKEGVAMTGVHARQYVVVALPHLTRRGEQVKVASSEQVGGEI